MKFALTPVISPRLLAALAVVVAGLASRAAVDRLLAQAGGGERVAAWAQLQSAAELVNGISATGVGVGLTVPVASEFLSLPLFALFLWILGERLSLVTAGAAWLATYLVYAIFNALALRHILRNSSSHEHRAI